MKPKPRRIIPLAAVAAIVSVTVVAAGNASSSTPITACSQVVTTNAYLTQDLYCPNADGVVVAASGIVIDLKGFTLRGNRAAGTIGVKVPSAQDALTIKNGVVRNFETGVRGPAVDNAKISGLVVSGNAKDGIDIDGIALSLSSSASSGNGNYGVYADGSGSKFSSSTFAANGFSGLAVAGDSTSVKSVIASGNAGDGMNLAGAQVKIEKSTASGNGHFGISLSGDAAKITGNHLEANGFAGGVSDLSGFGVRVANYTTAPAGTNAGSGNDDPVECEPVTLC